jgi:DHA1 family multidrug resistance protein-like MFS transporter
MGLTSGYIPNAMALVASQVPRERSGWALSTLSTAQISGVIGGPLLGGFLADHVGLRAYLSSLRSCWWLAFWSRSF